MSKYLIKCKWWIIKYAYIFIINILNTCIDILLFLYISYCYILIFCLYFNLS